VLLTGTMLGHVPAAYAGDNHRRDWDDKRVVQTPGAADGLVRVYGGGYNQWALVARNIGGDTWRLRESEGPLGFTNPTFLPATVTDFVADTTVDGYAFGAYVADGSVHAFRRDSRGRAASGVPFTVDQGGETRVAVGNTADALVTHRDTWRQHLGGRQSGIGGTGDTWVTYPDPNVDGAPGNAGQSFGFTANDLLAFWNDPNGDLRFAHRPLLDPTAAFSPARTVATGGEKYVDLVDTFSGGRLVTQAADGTIHIRSFDWNGAEYVVGQPRQLAGPVTSGEPVTEPQVLVDAARTLTVAWKEPGAAGGGLVLWQEDRPHSTYLERPTLVAGTRDSDARLVTSPHGSLAVALRRDSENAVVRVKHLPAGKARWTNGIRLVSPKPLDTSAGWAIGSPNRAQNFRVVVNDRVGVYGFRFDAPRPYTKVKKPVRKVQRDRSYRIGWNTSWAFADDWQVRARVDKGRRYGPWRSVAVPDGDRSKVVIRPRGEKRCYQAKGFRGGVQVGRWSTQRCVTVRR
jgi:hypothetical protein